MNGVTICSKCRRSSAREGQRYCAKCHAAYMRTTRPRHGDLKPDQKRRANARSYANTYLKRGVIVPQPCESCGVDDAEMHHPNYDSPLCVHWLCRPCHMAAHNFAAVRSHRRSAA